MKYIPVPNSLHAKGLNGYSDEGQTAKEAFHRDGQKFLHGIAAALGLHKQDYEVRSNKAGTAVSGEVTLHSDDLYVQLSEGAMGPGVRVMYRTCDSRKDYCGHQNHFAKMEQFRGAEAQGTLLRTLLRLMTAVRQAKAATATASASL